MMKVVTCTAPVNIAVIKYWGKRNEELILPINSSLSVTLHQDQLKTTTTVSASHEFTEDRIWLNGKEDNISHPRLQSCLNEIRRLARKRRSSSSGGSGEDSVSRVLNYKVHICSVNNFPTAAGLASSAAGYACLGKEQVVTQQPPLYNQHTCEPSPPCRKSVMTCTLPRPPASNESAMSLVTAHAPPAASNESGDSARSPLPPAMSLVTAHAPPCRQQ
ncbi:diphosphomevalonate decarboxylase [Phyllobates terribilis]|uniref:diphosphomevalonate decarboxylase n=1 Tax=Phyllobates terribilis TaxID=111132 RepID=UPI003CCB6998